jgi:uncharacterized protein YkwD
MIAKVFKVLGGGMTLSVFISLVVVAYFVGVSRGVEETVKVAQTEIDKIQSGSKSSVTSISKGEIPTPVATPKRTVISKPPSWGGPQLWEVVNKRRVEFGVNPLKERDELCTIASIRLNQLLELGKLDGHVGFSNMPTTRPDLKWIFDKYNISEFLVLGATSPEEAVALWENTLGHKKLLSGGEYSFGCIYAQNGFGVAIAAY